MPFEYGNSFGNRFKKGQINNPTGKNRFTSQKEGQKLQKYLADCMVELGVDLKTKEIKKQCKEIQNVLENIPSVKEVIVYNEFKVAQNISRIKNRFAKTIEQRLDKDESGELPMSNRDLSSLVSSLNSMSVSSNKIIEEYVSNRQQNKKVDENSPEPTDSMQIINLEPTK